MIPTWVTPLMMYAIYFCIIIAFWHYVVPKPAKHEIKKILGVFFRWLLWGKKLEDKGKSSKKPKEKTQRSSWNGWSREKI